LEVASRLAVRLMQLRTPEAIATAVVHELHSAFGYYLAVVHRLHDGRVLRVVAGAGRLAEDDANFLAWEQPITSGVNGRVARTLTPALVSDTRLDPDYLGRDPLVDPGSELSIPITVDGRCWGVLNLEQLARHAFDQDDLLLAEAVVAQTGAALHRCALLDEMEGSFSTTLAILCDALESKDPYTAQHAQQVADLAASTGEQLGIPRAQHRAVRYCALLHDIGKLGVRGELLTKAAALTPEEYAEVMEHSVIGAALLSRVPLLADIAPLVRSVHERWNGTGYPDGLAKDAIPLEARIVAVCDAWHAMTSDRPYRRALAAPTAIAELRRGAGNQFDPAVVEAFISVLSGGPGEVPPRPGRC
jgi:putative nucleotidyltransferase with HDIG domain